MLTVRTTQAATWKVQPTELVGITLVVNAMRCIYAKTTTLNERPSSLNSPKISPCVLTSSSGPHKPYGTNATILRHGSHLSDMIVFVVSGIWFGGI